jgi:cytochrome c553
MIKNMIKYGAYLFLFSFFSSNVIANTDISLPSKLNKCIVCHTISGNSLIGTWPKIAEQHSDYMIKQLIEFKKGKNGDRYDPTMFGMIQDIDESDMISLSNYFSNQILQKNKNKKFDREKAKLGKSIYLYGDNNTGIAACVGCHGRDGKGNKLAKYPVLRWQHKDYIITQMKKFKNSERSNDINGIMRDIAKCTSDLQIEALAEYISNMR